MSNPSWQFRAHLTALPADVIVGYRADPWSCPLAEWLSDVADQPVKVQEEAYFSFTPDSGPPVWQNNALWMMIFIQIIDNGEDKLLTVVNGHGRVTALDALVALDEAERLAAQRLLPQWCDSQQCAYRNEHGVRCRARGLRYHRGLVEHGMGSCAFALIEGLLCRTHDALALATPPYWWQLVRDGGRTVYHWRIEQEDD